MKLAPVLRVSAGRRLQRADWRPGATPGVTNKEQAAARVQEYLKELEKLQYRLYAEHRRALLVILQGTDASGKDGAIRHVFTGLNPQGCFVKSFKVPSAEESSHDFLWRIHHAVPAYGEIGIFNRSHYEDVLVPRVKKLVEKSVWTMRMRQINEFERYLTENGVTVLKFFLHVSKKEQRDRLRQRLEDPSRHWKLNPLDFSERTLWSAYAAAYEDVLRHCSTPWAPWYVIPADHKWYRNYAVSSVMVETLETLNPKLPEPTFDISKIKLD